MSAEPRLAGYGYEEVQEVLDGIDPDIGYDDWMRVLAGVHHQLRGSDDGLDLLDEWSQRGSKYVSRDDVAKHYRSFSSVQGRRIVTLKSVIRLRNDSLEAEPKAARPKLLADLDNCGDVDALDGLIEHARTMDLSHPLTLERVIKTIQTRQQVLVGAKVGKADLRKMLKPRPAAVQATGVGVRTHEYTEFGNADRLADAYGDNLTYVPQLDRWYEWRHHWRYITTARVEGFAQRVLRTMGDEANGMPDAMAQAHYEWVKASRNSRMVKNMVSLLSSRPGTTQVDVDKLDADPGLLGTRNGVVDLRTGKFREADRDDLITMVTAVDYDTRAKCPLFEKVVSDALNNDTEMVAWFQRLMGYTLLSNPKEQFMVIPYGSGSNGKGTILNAIREVLGDHAKNAKAETFMDTGRTSDGPNESVLRLKGSRFVYMSEPSSGAAFNTGLVKTVTGGDAVTARAPWGKASIEFVPTWVIIMPTNHKPIIKDSDDGIWRRMKLIPFVRKFTGAEKDADLPEKLKAEYPGILRWLVSGALEYQRVGLGAEPRPVSEAHGSYRQDMDVLHDWLTDEWERDPRVMTPSSAVVSSWQRWCEKNNPMMKSSNKWLTRELLTRGFQDKRTNAGVQIIGLKPKSEQRTAESEGFEEKAGQRPKRLLE
jgi:putative DNA primase/helicase